MLIYMYTINLHMPLHIIYVGHLRQINQVNKGMNYIYAKNNKKKDAKRKKMNDIMSFIFFLSIYILSIMIHVINSSFENIIFAQSSFTVINWSHILFHFLILFFFFLHYISMCDSFISEEKSDKDHLTCIQIDHPVTAVI